jgi:8-oxo-dGTP pyrophosphatase MutT (NUDIX family)
MTPLLIVHREDGHGAGVIDVLPDDRVAVVGERIATDARDWEIPAGLLDVAGEDALAAAQRELAEEADLTASRWDVLSDFARTASTTSSRLAQRTSMSASSSPRAKTSAVARRATRRGRSVPVPSARRPAGTPSAVRADRAVEAYLRHISIERGM